MWVLRKGLDGEADPVGDLVAGEGVPDLIGPARVLGRTGIEDGVEEASRAFARRCLLRAGDDLTTCCRDDLDRPADTIAY